MPYEGISKRKLNCAICKKSIPAGNHVYHDPTKAVGNHIAHKKCYEDLLKSREKRKPTLGKKLSDEELDPPF